MMEDGRLMMHDPSSVIHHRSSIVSHPSSVVSHPSSASIISHPSRVIHHESSIISHPSSIIHHQSSIMFREPRAPKLCPKSVIVVTNGVAMVRHGPILREIEATPSGELLKHLPGPPGPVFGPKTTKKVENPGKSKIPVFPRIFC